jgi:hypothetical protein
MSPGTFAWNFSLAAPEQQTAAFGKRMVHPGVKTPRQATVSICKALHAVAADRQNRWM